MGRMEFSDDFMGCLNGIQGRGYSISSKIIPHFMRFQWDFMEISWDSTMRWTHGFSWRWTMGYYDYYYFRWTMGFNLIWWWTMGFFMKKRMGNIGSSYNSMKLNWQGWWVNQFKEQTQGTCWTWCQQPLVSTKLHRGHTIRLNPTN